MPVHRVYIYASTQGPGRDVRIRIHLRNEWSFAATFPISLCSRQEVCWHVASNTVGELQELQRHSGSVPYLFYETA